MKVTMRVNISGTRDGQDWPRIGESIDLPDAEAVDLLNAGIARPAPAPEPEVAVVPDASERRATKPHARRS